MYWIIFQVCFASQIVRVWFRNRCYTYRCRLTRGVPWWPLALSVRIVGCTCIQYQTGTDSFQTVAPHVTPSLVCRGYVVWRFVSLLFAARNHHFPDWNAYYCVTLHATCNRTAGVNRSMRTTEDIYFGSVLHGQHANPYCIFCALLSLPQSDSGRTNALGQWRCYIKRASFRCSQHFEFSRAGDCCCFPRTAFQPKSPPTRLRQTARLEYCLGLEQCAYVGSLTAPLPVLMCDTTPRPVLI